MDYCSEKKVPQIETLDDLIASLRLIFDSDSVDVNYVQDVMYAYKSNPNEWRKYAYFDKHRYTRNLIDSGNGKYNLMLLCWSEGQGSSIHDHADAHCFMKILSGNLHEVRFEWPNAPKSEEVNNNCIPSEEMKSIGENHLKLNEVAYINDSIGLHRVENRSHTFPAVSLHLYCPPFSKCQTFDQRTGLNAQVKVTFYSKHGMRTPFKASKNNQILDKSLTISGKQLIEFENESEN